jgi:hypothetical protein
VIDQGGQIGDVNNSIAGAVGISADSTTAGIGMGRLKCKYQNCEERYHGE